MRLPVALAAVSMIALSSACASSSTPGPSPQASSSVIPSSAAVSWPSPTAPRVALGAVADLAVSSQAVYALYTPAGTQGKLAGAAPRGVPRQVGLSSPAPKPSLNTPSSQ